ncbi:unnamed protein product [Pleuronectes platessa]|uniref:Uncharacterized protein n=1 Tax=Pleuronectes platessa TaxID=8262 RepID=A0A9N7VW56_PLEPL|nr:unnamed protein product [Pleuronectes platessa]
MPRNVPTNQNEPDTSSRGTTDSVTKLPRRCPGDHTCGGREGMEESYETLEEELGTSRADPPRHKPVRQIHRPEMYAARKIREEMAPASQQPRAEPKTLLREPSFPRTPSLPKTLSAQIPAQIETPWENVTLNRCLFVVITILVLTSGFQRLHGEFAKSGGRSFGLKVRRSETLRHRGQPSEPQTSLWELMLLWLPDLDDEEDEEEEDDDVEVIRGRAKRGAMARAPRGFRNRPLPERKLTKQRDGKLKDRRVRKARGEETKDKKKRDKEEELEEAAREEEEDQGDDEEIVPENNKRLEEKREKKETQKESSTVI